MFFSCSFFMSSFNLLNCIFHINFFLHIFISFLSSNVEKYISNLNFLIQLKNYFYFHSKMTFPFSVHKRFSFFVLLSRLRFGRCRKGEGIWGKQLFMAQQILSHSLNSFHCYVRHPKKALLLSLY